MFEGSTTEEQRTQHLLEILTFQLNLTIRHNKLGCMPTTFPSARNKMHTRIQVLKVSKILADATKNLFSIPSS